MFAKFSTYMTCIAFYRLVSPPYVHKVTYLHREFCITKHRKFSLKIPNSKYRSFNTKGVKNMNMNFFTYFHSKQFFCSPLIILLDVIAKNLTNTTSRGENIMRVSGPPSRPKTILIEL